MKVKDLPKYRIWNRDRHIMQYLRGFNVPRGESTSMVIYFEPDGSELVYLSRVALMECTKIENNKTPDLVYEGDILQDCDLERWVVCRDEKEAAFICKHIPLDTEIFFGEMRIFQIIGNIYENPELLQPAGEEV